MFLRKNHTPLFFSQRNSRLYRELKTLLPDIIQRFVSASHTIILFSLLFLTMVVYNRYFYKPTNSYPEQLKTGFFFATVFLIGQGLLYFPSGPFSRPHPVFWRFLFSLSLVYLCLLIVLFFLSLNQIRRTFAFIDPSLGVPLEEFPYAEDCSLTVENVTNVLKDPYFLSHFFGWFAKALMLRHRGLLWLCSIFWEFVELGLTFCLENFKECWWDSWVIDVLLSNGLGIELGLALGKYLEMKQYDWLEEEQGHNFVSFESLKLFLQGLRKQFRPENWIVVDWKKTSFGLNWRFSVIIIIILGLTVADANVFFLKYMFWIPPSHWILIVRLVLVFLMSLPSMRQIYLFCLDPKKMPFGMQASVLVGVLVMELLIICRFYTEVFPSPLKGLVAKWVGGVFIFVSVIRAIVWRIEKRKRKETDN